VSSFVGWRSGVVEVNSVGDVILSDARTIGALADTDRFELVERLRALGSASVAELAAASGTTEAAVGEMLARLAEAGLVSAAGVGRWAAVGRGLLLEVPDDPEGERAARQLASIIMLRNADIPRRWAADDEPHLDRAWFRSAGALNARLTMTPAELDEFQQQIERLMEPYLHRDPSTAGTGPVRLLAYFLPSAGR
jgi:DNA-binding transcriptional ArsR family regulator